MQVEKPEERTEIAVGKKQKLEKKEGRASESGSSPLAGFFLTSVGWVLALFNRSRIHKMRRVHALFGRSFLALILSCFDLYLFFFLKKSQKYFNKNS